MKFDLVCFQNAQKKFEVICSGEVKLAILKWNDNFIIIFDFLVKNILKTETWVIASINTNYTNKILIVFTKKLFMELIHCI